MEAPPSSPTLSEENKIPTSWEKRAEETRILSKTYQKKYYEARKEKGLLTKLKQCYDKDARRLKYEEDLKDESKKILEKARESHARRKQEAELLIVKNAMEGASEGKKKLLQQLIDGGVFNKLTLKQKREILESK
jgi:hypothetical protein